MPDTDRSMIYKIDPRTNQVAMAIPIDLLGAIGIPGRSGIAAGEGAVWAITSNNELRRYSAEGGTLEAAISLPSHSSGVIVAFGSVWITGTGNDELYRVDPTTNQIAATIDLHSNPRSLAVGEGSVWVHNEGNGTVQRIDGKSGDLVATIETGTVGKGTIAVGGGFVWVSTRAEPIIQMTRARTRSTANSRSRCPNIRPSDSAAVPSGCPGARCAGSNCRNSSRATRQRCPGCWRIGHVP